MSRPIHTTQDRPWFRWAAGAAMMFLLTPATACSNEDAALSELGVPITTDDPVAVGDGDQQVDAADDYQDFTPPELVIEEGTEPPAEELDEAEAPTLAETIDEAYLDQAPEHERLALAETTCEGLGELYISTFQGVLDRLGNAGRNDAERIDEAMESFGAGGQIIATRFNELGCSEAERQAVACTGAERLNAEGDVARDLVALLDAGCGNQAAVEG